MQPRRYSYVGPPELKQRLKRESHCVHVSAVSELLSWTAAFLPKGKRHGAVTATFIIDTTERLWIADRRSEHVACADGQDVLAAGEICFERSGDHIEIVEVSNYSTGYCPEPECWPVVARVLDGLKIPRPTCFTSAFSFRRCDHCGTINLIKDGVYECAVCNSPLSTTAPESNNPR